MASLPSSKLSCLFVASGILCAGQSERAAAMGWADYYATAYRVPPELVHAIIEVESAWQSRAMSTKGAAGLMQLMPATAVTFGVTNRFDVQQNIRGGVAYLARLMKVFNGDLRLATAAYVAGENRILSAGLQYSDADVFEYVSKVARLYQQKRLKRLRMEPLAEIANKGGNSP
jgi:Predicted soluble lytic transglycosylase fused to an ABC-type amino acid-binding protein